MQRHLQLAKTFTKLLDNQFSFMGIKFGIDPLLDLIPGIGNFIGVALSFYLIWIAREMHLPAEAISRMIMNILVDFMIGVVPVLGTIADIAYRANTKNLAIIQSYLDKNITEGETVT